jgi:hypothetical protein
MLYRSDADSDYTLQQAVIGHAVVQALARHRRIRHGLSLFLGMVLQCLSATAGNRNGSRWGHVVPTRNVADNGGPHSPEKRSVQDLMC